MEMLGTVHYNWHAEVVVYDEDDDVDDIIENDNDDIKLLVEDMFDYLEGKTLYSTNPPYSL